MCKNLFICTLLIISYISNIEAQKIFAFTSTHAIHKALLIPKNGYYWLADNYLKNTVSYSQLIFKTGNLSYDSAGSLRLSYSFFDVNHLPIFCKIEHLIEQKSKIPFRFRIGSLEDANRMEGK